MPQKNQVVLLDLTPHIPIMKIKNSNLHKGEIAQNIPIQVTNLDVLPREYFPVPANYARFFYLWIYVSNYVKLWRVSYKC